MTTTLEKPKFEDDLGKILNEPNKWICSELGAADMLFHVGLTWRTGSAGCQTMHPDIYKQFWNELNSDGNPGVIGYTIVRWKSL